MVRYRCIKKLVLDKYDDNGFFCEDEMMKIEPGEVFEAVGVPYNIVAGSDAIHLESKDAWCELYPSTIAEFFEKLP